MRRESDQTGSILIDNNEFTENSAIIGSNVLNIYLFTYHKYTSEFTDTNMICANVRISDNQFIRNIGWFNAAGTVQAIWYDNDDLSAVENSLDHWFTPTAPVGELSSNKAIAGVVAFDTEDVDTLPSSSVLIDKNKFLMSGNTYEGNYAGQTAAITQLYNIRRLNIYNELYKNNRGQFKAALNYYGSLKSTGEDGQYGPATYSLHSYYDPEHLGRIIKYPKEYTNYQYRYPLGCLFVSGSYDIEIKRTTFDDNAMQETRSEIQTVHSTSQALVFAKCHGNLFIDELTIQNYNGMSAEEINQFPVEKM